MRRERRPPTSTSVLIVVLAGLVADVGLGSGSAAAHPVALASAGHCNPAGPSPSALFLSQSSPSHLLQTSGTIQASYEFEVVNYTASVNGTKVSVPTVLVLFPLADGTDFQLTIRPVATTVVGAGWSNPGSSATTSTVGHNLSFSSTAPPQLLTEGWFPSTPVADAVQAGAAYGNLTLAFRWQWTTTEPGGTVYASGWSTPSRSASAPYLPSIFYPAPLVTATGQTSPVLIGQNFTDSLSGFVAGRSFNLTWEDSGGHLLSQGTVSAASSVTTLAAMLPLLSSGHRLSPGTYAFHVLDSCGALVQDLWVSGGYAAHAAVQLQLAPSTCGTIILNGTVYHSGATPSLAPSASSYSLTSTGCTGDAFVGWSEYGGLLPSSTFARNARVFVSWNGSLRAAWAPGHWVTFREAGAKAGQSWSVSVDGQTVMATAPNTIGFFLANGTYEYFVGNGTGYSSDASPGTVQVAGAPVNRSITVVPDIQHVVTIVMENSNLWPTLRYAPYMDYLWSTYAKATWFYGACHQSKPEYMAMTSGRPYSCASIPVQNVTHLGDLLETKGLTWMSYFESMNSSCDNVSSHLYFTHHNPFLWYSDVGNNASRCNAHIVNSRLFNQTVANGTLPTYSLYIPNNDDDCEWTILPTCDAWLKSFLSPLLNSSHPVVQRLMAHTAVVVVFDEAQTNLGYSTGGILNSWCTKTTGQNLSVCGGHIYLSLMSPFSLGRTYALNATDYNLESTVEWLFGLGSDGGYDGTPNFPSMNSLFSFPQNGS